VVGGRFFGVAGLAVLSGSGGARFLSYYLYNSTGNAWTLYRRDPVDESSIGGATGQLAAADFVKLGRAGVLLTRAHGFRAAPAPIPTVAVQSAMLGSFDGAPDVRAIAGGRIFGYAKAQIFRNVRVPYTMPHGPEPEIAFIKRTPAVAKPDSFRDEPANATGGWPTRGERVTFRIPPKNKGDVAVPAGDCRLKVWIDRPEQNADSAPGTWQTPDQVFTIADSLAPFQSSALNYKVVDVGVDWPYDIVSGTGPLPR